MQYKYELGIVGAGNMATAIINGIRKNNVLPLEKILLFDVNKDQLKIFSDIQTTTSNDEVYKNSKYILLAVKPQIFSVIAKEIEAKCKSKYLISIMAGIGSRKIADLTNIGQVFRIMPNTPCRIGEGMSVIAENENDADANEFVKNIFTSLGKTLVLNEELFDVVTSISGSGPAYVYYFIKSIMESGMENGLTVEQSKLLTLQTFIGAAKMVENSDAEIDSLISAVCSKGGTTIEAIESFRSDKIDEKIKSGVDKCRKKSEILGRNAQ